MIQAVGALQPGDIVVTEVDRKDWLSRLVMWALRSPWTHVFIVKDERTIIESWFPSGVREQPLDERFAQLAQHGQTWRILRVPAITPSKIAAVLTAAESMLGRKYDLLQALFFGLFHSFIDDGPKRITCSRFVTAAFSAAGVDLFPSAVLREKTLLRLCKYTQLRKGWIIPQDLLDYANVVEILPKHLAVIAA